MRKRAAASPLCAALLLALSLVPQAAIAGADAAASQPVKTTERIELARAAVALDPMALQAWEELIDALRREQRGAELAQAQKLYAHVRSQTVLREAGEPHLLFARQGELIAPLAMLSKGGISDFPSSEREERYYRPGRLYYAYAAGVQGKVVVSGKKEVGCSSNTAHIREVTPISGDAIVSNAALPQASVSQAAYLPDAAQDSQVRALAGTLLRQHKVPARHIDAALKEWPGENQGLQNFAAVPGANGQAPALVANLMFEGGSDVNADVSFALSLIAEAQPAGGYAVTYSSFSEGETSTSRYAFLGSADLDGDGQQEIVLTGYGYEWWWYEVLRKSRGTWVRKAKASGGGC
ncbi:hypothetical protein [Massilia sp. BJB1822]|uniref:hypothetical protein n=1 Tax=Massilia sp. BJB1822 TaxID=2744470 RepID=UPI001594CCBB|nr:hypothetical protein [Massilia sp. BJB1822]NVE01521.1 hypothetical protein [Massilia sp. BJB1822]